MSIGGELLLTIFQKHLHIRSMFFAQRECAKALVRPRKVPSNTFLVFSDSRRKIIATIYDNVILQGYMCLPQS